MLQLIARYRGIVVVGVLLLMPLFLLYAQTKRPGARGPVVGVALDFSHAVERALLFVVGGIVDGIERYVTAVGNDKELVALRRDAQSSRRLEAELRELEIENDELRALARLSERIEGPRPLGARVLARTGYPLSRLLTIDVGSSEGVRRGDGVLDKDGVLGVVLATGRVTSDVLLLSDPSSSVDVVIQRTRARGVLRGEDSDERYGARVEDFDKLRDVRPGDTLVTSGIGTRFPPGLFVGTVESAEAPDDSLYVRASVKPAAHFATVERVLVLVHREPPRSPRLGREPADEEIFPQDAGPAARPLPPPRRDGAVGADAGPAAAGPGAPDAGVVDAGVAAAADAGAPAPAIADAGVAPAPEPAPPAAPAPAPAPPPDGGTP